MTSTKKFIIEFVAAFIFFVGVIYLVRVTGLDLTVSDKAFELTGFESTAMLETAAWIGKYLSVIFCSVLILILPWLLKKQKNLAREAIMAIAILVIGPGLLNNFIFKPFFQRPRPVQIERYNESATTKFTPALTIGKNENDTSFPSGHSGAAFFFIFPWFCLRFRKKYGIRLIIPGLIFGIMTGSVRILEGRHFLSDVTASLAVVYLTGTLLSFLTYRSVKDTFEENSEKLNEATPQEN